MSFLSTGPGASRPMAMRAINIKMYPVPRNFAERREVMRVVQEFGELEMYRSLKYTSSRNEHVAVAVFKHESSAQKLVEATPIRYTIEPVQSSYGKTSNIPGSNMDSEVSNNANPSPSRHFQLDCQIANNQMFNKGLVRFSSKLEGSWVPLQLHESAFAMSLSKQLPRSAAAAGLIDWETGSSATPGINKDMITAVPSRIANKIADNKRRSSMATPKEMWIAGQNNKGNPVTEGTNIKA